MQEKIWENILAIRKNSPLVHNITNYVVMNNTANALLAAGASPVMAHAPEEMKDMVTIAGALAINIGTLSAQWIKAMKIAMKQAISMDKPVIFDPVGVGATPYRNKTTAELIEHYTPTVIRGNASEIMATVSSEQKTKGVDSTMSSNNAVEAAQYLNKKYGSTVCISGEKDIIINKHKRANVMNGHELMARVTGMGCTATSIIAAFCVVEKDYFVATLSGMALMGVAGELAQPQAKGPGSLQVAFLDKLYNITENEFMNTIKIEIKNV
jgi:hydroxyethylthiazole kinase